jgi:hypothetical protein
MRVAAENAVEKIPDGIILRARARRRRQGGERNYGERYGREAAQAFEPKSHGAIIAQDSPPRIRENAARGESRLDAWPCALASRILGPSPRPLS